MATFTTFGGGDIDLRDIPDFYSGLGAVTAVTNSTNVTVGGVTYATSTKIDLVSGDGPVSLILYGTGLSSSIVNGRAVVAGGGTIGAVNIGTATDGSFISGLSYSSTSFNSFAQTATGTDDAAAASTWFSGNDTMTGGAQDDYIKGYGGNDQINGGTGVNTALFTGTVSQYTVNSANGTITVTDNTASRDGVDTLTNIQQLQFSDQTVVFDLQSSQDLLVYKIYQAAYGRIPDLAGFRYWASVADSTHASATVLAHNFTTAAEFTQVYGGNPSNNTYVTGLYTHVLGRAPDQAGLDYWVGVANSGATRDALLVSFATSAENASLIGAHVSNGYWTAT